MEYKRIFDFFVVDTAGLVLNVCEIDMKKFDGKTFDLKGIYGKMTTK
jgi:hypothetical protein